MSGANEVLGCNKFLFHFYISFFSHVPTVFELSKRRWGSTFSLGGGVERRGGGVENLVRHGVAKIVGGVEFHRQL